MSGSASALQRQDVDVKKGTVDKEDGTAKCVSRPAGAGADRQKSASSIGSDRTNTSGGGPSAEEPPHTKDRPDAADEAGASADDGEVKDKRQVVVTSVPRVGAPKIVVVEKSGGSRGGGGGGKAGPPAPPAISVRRGPVIGISGATSNTGSDSHEPPAAGLRRKHSDDSGTPGRVVTSAVPLPPDSSRPLKKRRVEEAAGGVTVASGGSDRSRTASPTPPPQARDASLDYQQQPVIPKIVLAGKPQQPPNKLQRQSSASAAAADTAAGGNGSSTDQVVQAMLLLQRMSGQPPQASAGKPAASPPPATAPPPPPAGPSTAGFPSRLSSTKHFTVETGASAFRPVLKLAASAPAPTSSSSAFATAAAAFPAASGAGFSSAAAAGSTPAHVMAMMSMQQQHAAGDAAVNAQMTQMHALQLAMLLGGHPAVAAAMAAQQQQQQHHQLVTGPSSCDPANTICSLPSSGSVPPTDANAPGGGSGAKLSHPKVKAERLGSGLLLMGGDSSNGCNSPRLGGGPGLAAAAAGSNGRAAAADLQPLDAGPCMAEEEPKGALWTGKVKHRHRDSTVELFCLTCLLPERFQEQFPPSLFVSDLPPRSATKLGAYYPVQCRLDFLSDTQLKKLDRLATMSLVADCRLQHCRLVLVPLHEPPQQPGRTTPELVVRGYLVETP